MWCRIAERPDGPLTTRRVRHGKRYGNAKGIQEEARKDLEGKTGQKGRQEGLNAGPLEQPFESSARRITAGLAADLGGIGRRAGVPVALSVISLLQTALRGAGEGLVWHRGPGPTGRALTPRVPYYDLL